MKTFTTTMAFFLVVCFTNASAKDYRSPNDVELPAISKRQIIGTWYDKDTRCTRSLEKVKSTTYKVLRCSDGSGGNDGTPLKQIGSMKYSPKNGSSHGDYYQIENNGELGIYDNQGLIDRLPKHSELRP